MKKTKELKGKDLKKIKWIFLGVLLSLLGSNSVWADVLTEAPKPDYATDYYMIVECAQGGIDLYLDANPESTKLNEELLPNGTGLYIEGEKAGSDKKDWGYVKYQGEQGYVPLDDLKPATRPEAIQAEMNIHGWKAADYDLQVNGKDGSVPLYYGPGEKYQENTAPGTIANGETLHISKETTDEDGKGWGLTEAAGTEGWVNLEEAQGNSAEDSNAEDGSAEDSNAEDSNAEDSSVDENSAEDGSVDENTVDAISDDALAAENGRIAEMTPAGAAAVPETAVTPTGIPVVTEKAKSSELSSTTMTPVPTSDATADPAQQAAEPTAAAAAESTQQAAATEMPTEAAEVSPAATEMPTEAAEVSPAATEMPTEAAETSTASGATEAPETSPTEKESVQTSAAAWTTNPLVWAGAAAVLILLLLIIYFIKKKESK